MVGIDAKNKNILDPKFVCPICSLILRDPVQLSPCGHRQCQLCFESQNGSTIKCSQCRTETPRNQVMIDRGFKGDMQSLPIDCSFCHWTGILKNYQDHLDQCHSNPKYEYCGREFDSVNTLNEHKVSQCQEVTIDCLLKNFGCSEQILRGKKAQHYLTKQHQDTVLKAIQQIQPQLLDTQMSDTLNNDGQRLNNESLYYQSTLRTSTQDFSQVQLSVEETKSDLEGLKSNQDILEQELASLKEKIEDMQYVSYDGSFTWKITNVREKMADAESERQTSIYSPPFYSSPTGYKMRARLYLHSDGNARRTHMSLFFVLMRNAYDPILRFPFNYKVTFCLYDQTPQQRHIIDSFRPDIMSNSFQRPRSEMNIASGIPKFFPLAMIQQEGNPYVRDDTMFIKVMVDFGGMPEALLSHALSLNPGLPLFIQQEAMTTDDTLSQEETNK